MIAIDLLDFTLIIFLFFHPVFICDSLKQSLHFMLKFLIDASVSHFAFYFSEDLIDTAHNKIIVLSRFPKGENDRWVIEIVIDKVAWIIYFLDSCTNILVDIVIKSHRVFIKHVA